MGFLQILKKMGAQDIATILKPLERRLKVEWIVLGWQQFCYTHTLKSNVFSKEGTRSIVCDQLWGCGVHWDGPCNSYK